MPIPRLILKPGKDKPLRQRHPWVFSGAVASLDACADGAVVDVHADTGDFLGRGTCNRQSQIVARVLTWVDEPVDRAFVQRRVAAAQELRRRCGLTFNSAPTGASATNAFRLINAEADLLPGLIVDAYGPFLVLQVLTRGMVELLPDIIAVLTETLSPQGLYERSDVELREREGLAPATGVLWGAAPPANVQIVENGLPFLVDLAHGQKTGFFLDQRDNRATCGAMLASYAAAGAFAGRPPEVLNAFAYTGAFATYALRAVPTAHLTNLDASVDALATARRNLALTVGETAAAMADYTVGNAFEVLRKYRDCGRQFDAIILDPPKFATSQAQIPKASRGYKDLNLLAIKLLRPGGWLATFSCSGAISPDLFQKILFGAAADAGRDVQVLARLHPGPDHPLLLAFPEGEYLKGLLVHCR